MFNYFLLKLIHFIGRSFLAAFVGCILNIANDLMVISLRIMGSLKPEADSKGAFIQIAGKAGGR